MSTLNPPTFNAPLIEGLRQLSRDVIEEGNNRVAYLNIREKKFRDAEKKGQKLTENQERNVSMITPSPYLDPKSGIFDWRYHILHRERDLREQLKYLHHLADDIRVRLSDIEDNSDEILYSNEAQERIMKFYIASAKEMGVDVDPELQLEWLPGEDVEMLVPSG